MQNLCERVSALEKANEESCQRNLEAINAVPSDLLQITRNEALSDTCEMLVTGIPINLEISNVLILEKIFNALELSHVSAFVLETREWRLVELSENSNIANTVDSHNNYNNNVNSNSAHFRSFVVKFSSYCVRDNVAFKCSKLAKFDCNSLFGKRGNKHIFLRPP